MGDRMPSDFTNFARGSKHILVQVTICFGMICPAGECANMPPTPRMQYHHFAPFDDSVKGNDGIPDSAKDTVRNFVFVELFGSAASFISLNYDYRFSNLISIRAGIGVVGNFGIDVPADSSSVGFPVLNGMLQFFPFTNWNSSVETGIGFVYAFLPKSVPDYLGMSAHQLLPTMMLGYRWQPMEGGFSIKANVCWSPPLLFIVGLGIGGTF